MDTSLFLQQFGHLAESPDGIQKLRNLILDLAVRGKLVPQNPHEEPASVLIEGIEAEKRRLIRVGEIKKSEKLPPISDDEKPYHLPHGWEWTRLAEIGEINPRNEIADNLTVSFIPMSLIPERYGSFPDMEEKLWGEVKKGYTHFAENDIALAKITPCFQNGKACVMRNLINGVGAGTTELHIFRDITHSLYVAYVYLFLKSPNFVRDGEAVMTGTAGQQRVPKDYFSLTPLPLPPLAEQQRIVARVDELMQLCDQLEAEQVQREHLHERAAKSTLFHLAGASTKSEALHYWQYAVQYFPELFDRVSTVEDLRAAILQLAVQGRLVPQNPGDEPASVLLERIEAEKERLIKAGEIKKSDKLPPISDSEKSYELPQGWEWVRLGNLSSKVTDGEHQTPPRTSTGFPLLSAKNVRQGYIDFENHDLISEADFNRCLERCNAQRGDLLMVSVGATIGRCAIVLDEPQFALVRSVALIRAVFSSGKYLLYCLSSPYLQEQISDSSRGGAQPCLYLNKINLLNVPFPPLDEQYRIVAKVDELMRLCDQLEEEATYSRELSAKLMDSIVYHLFESVGEG